MKTASIRLVRPEHLTDHVWELFKHVDEGPKWFTCRGLAVLVAVLVALVMELAATMVAVVIAAVLVEVVDCCMGTPKHRCSARAKAGIIIRVVATVAV